MFWFQEKTETEKSNGFLNQLFLGDMDSNDTFQTKFNICSNPALTMSLERNTLYNKEVSTTFQK